MIAVAVASGACSADGDEETLNDTGETVTTAPPETTTTTVPVEQEVEEAYLAYWAMLDRLAQDPNPDDPEIRERASGQALEELLDFVTGMQDAGWRGEFGEQHTHEILSVTVDNADAVVLHCAVDDSSVIDTATGEIVREGVATRVYESTLGQESTEWRVESVSEIDPWPEAGACS